MKLFTIDKGWAGGACVIASTKEEAYTMIVAKYGHLRSEGYGVTEDWEPSEKERENDLKDYPNRHPSDGIKSIVEHDVAMGTVVFFRGG